MSLTSSLEDYLEAIFVIRKKQGYVRCVDVAIYLSVSKPSVSRAIKELTKKRYTQKEANATLSLTEQGEQLAKLIYEKHLFFTNQLVEAGVPYDIAIQDACRLEHDISEESFRKLKIAVQKKKRRADEVFDGKNE
ncbi:MAG: metal-dependent transcriptional regulator [Ruminococcus sp.]|nr:metal-dependent transcriptional regulator [Ruminococcus sp.]MBS5452942.1 metal-dependent transcriptional regulator [Ruminococcus sp.]